MQPPAGNRSELTSEGAMSQEELQEFKEAAEKMAQEYNTPEKAREMLIKIGYLNADGSLPEEFR